MEAKLKSVSKNQILKLACKFALLTVFIFSYEYTREFLYLFLLALVLAIFYFRPAVNNGKFLLPLSVTLAMLFIIPEGLELDWYIYFSIAMGLALAGIIGLKNLLFLRKANIYFGLNFILACFLNIFFFHGFLEYLGAGAVIMLFAGVFALFKDFYMNGLKLDKMQANFAASIIALIIVELSWTLSIAPIFFWLRDAALIASLFVIHDLYIKHLKSRE